MTGLMERLGLEEDVPIESPMVTRSIENAQKKVEGRNFDQRKNVLEYDDVMNQQRKTIYALRRQVLDGRYHREPTEDEEKKRASCPSRSRRAATGRRGADAARSSRSSATMIDVQASCKRDRRRAADAAATSGSPAAAATTASDADDARPGWRVLRAEIWRQFGTLLDLEKPTTGRRDELLAYCVDDASRASQIQQRERIYDLSHERMAA